jgi:microcystin degradation protein MlrC
VKILLAECMQEISSFNPVLSEYGNFTVRRGQQLLAQRGQNSALAGAVSTFTARGDVSLAPAYGARAGSAGLLSQTGWARLADEILGAIAESARGIDGVYFSMHGAMGADGELDPEGYLLEQTRRIVGDRVPIVLSLDLHGVLTERMLRHIDGLTLYHTYPHVDFADTGARAATLLMTIVDRRLNPVIGRVVMPTLVRGDELITKSGCYGDIVREAQLLEREGRALAAGVMIGNPFTDVPELCSQVVIVAESDEELVRARAVRLSEAFWANRARMQGKLIPLDRAIAEARHMVGPVIFTDAADAPSSGASGDSNAILAALLEARYDRRVLLPIMDPPAVAAAIRAGIGATVSVPLGGALDTRFTPVEITGIVDTLSRGRAVHETSGGEIDAGPTAVLVSGSYTIVVLTKPAGLFDRAVFFSHGRNPRDYDLIVVKSPHCEYHMFDEWAEKDFNIDAPGSTSANLRSLGHTICRRPMYPLDADVTFAPRPEIFHAVRR